MHRHRVYLPAFLLVLAFVFSPAATARPPLTFEELGKAQEVAPLSTRSSGSRVVGRWSERTLVVGLSVDRDGARVVAFTAKCRPFERSVDPPKAESYEEGEDLQLELVLLGPGGRRFTQRTAVPGLCLDHPGDFDSHVEGDRIRVHRDGILVDLPELAGFDRVEAAYYRRDRGADYRVLLGSEALVPERFNPAGGDLVYSDLALGGPDAESAGEAMAFGSVHWPEEYEDTERYRVYGNESEFDKRINIVIVPDGYVYADKATMVNHAQEMVDFFRRKTPFKEHDAFINYILVFAYSNAAGTDQCDCDIFVDTAMNTAFPKVSENFPCGDTNNRCLYYGYPCGGDTSTANIVAAEQRAPALDSTVIMVNSTRYGGCGGTRASYAAGDGAAKEVALHEFAHSFANLDDEYWNIDDCGTHSGEINTSLNSTQGAWPEWIADIGAPREGAQYFEHCIYRPTSACNMLSLSQDFCEVCNQRLALAFFGHSRVSPTAPIASQSPSSPVTFIGGAPVTFSVDTRLASGTNVTNSVTWKIAGPDYPTPTTVAVSQTVLDWSFTQIGTYTMTCEVVADTNYIKPSKNGANANVATWTVNSSCAVPGAPGGVTATTNRCDEVQVTWEPVEGATGYTLHCGTECGEVMKTFEDVASPYTDTTAEEGWIYRYWVSAVNSCGDGLSSACATGGLPVVPEAPAVVNASSIRCADVQVYWEPVAGATGYYLYRGTECGGVEETFEGVPSPFFDTSAVPGTSYQYWVKASNPCHTGPASPCATGVRRETPQAPSDVAASTVRCGGVMVSWSGVDGAFAYEVHRGTSCGTSEANYVVGESPYYDISGDEDETYQYWVVASNNCGKSPDSTCAVGRRGVPTPPRRVTASTDRPTDIRVTWGDAIGAASYTVARGAICGAMQKLFPGVSSPFDDATAVTGTNYQYWVVALNECGTSALSDCAAGVRASGLPGDGDGDGVVSIGEVQQAINMFLGTQPPGNGVDCSGDGTISIGEVQKVINGFLGLASTC